MTPFGKSIVSILAAGAWITLSEFVRNELLLKSKWIEHYQALGMTFPSEPVNGIVWMVWSFLFAGAVYAISRKYSLLRTFLLSWFMGFVLMWLVIGNMNVLPLGILPFAIPLSLLEAFVAAYLIEKIAPAGSRPV
ncbi:MAG: hypothetical protein IH600_00380 [Bacteroidetes bacterium]|nr:hypothetical protein [Bacteroidota bacterium]